MSKPMIRLHDIATNEIIDREMTAAELKIYEAQLKANAELKAEAEAKAAQRQAILDRLGLTSEEAALLLS
jgi:hypothetical protein